MEHFNWGHHRHHHHVIHLPNPSKAEMELELAEVQRRLAMLEARPPDEPPVVGGSMVFAEEVKTIVRQPCVDPYYDYITITYLYAVNSIVYDCYQATQGQLYKVAIKEVRLVRSHYGQIVALYTDTLNELWNEYDLCTDLVAVPSAIAYYTNRQAELITAIANCPP